MATLTEINNWYCQSPHQLKSHLKATLQKELEWLLKDTQEQVQTTVRLGLLECHEALSSTKQRRRSSTASIPDITFDNGPFKLVVSSGQSDIVKGIVSRAGVGIVDFDIKIKLTNHSSSHSNIMSSLFNAMSLGHNHDQDEDESGHNHEQGIRGNSSGSSTVGKVGAAPPLFSHSIGEEKHTSSGKSPYHPFCIMMNQSPSKLDHNILPLIQIVDCVKNLEKAVQNIQKLQFKSISEAIEMMADTLGLVKSACNCLKAPTPGYTPNSSTYNLSIESGGNEYNPLDFVIPSSYFERPLPNNTIVSFYVSDGNVVTEVRVLEPESYRLPDNSSPNASTSTGFGIFRKFSQHNHNSQLLSKSSSTEKSPSLLAVDGGGAKGAASASSHLSPTPMNHATPGGSGSATPIPRTFGNRIIRDYIKVESPDPNLITASAKLRGKLN